MNLDQILESVGKEMDWKAYVFCAVLGITLLVKFCNWMMTAPKASDLGEMAQRLLNLLNRPEEWELWGDGVSHSSTGTFIEIGAVPLTTIGFRVLTSP